MCVLKGKKKALFVKLLYLKNRLRYSLQCIERQRYILVNTTEMDGKILFKFLLSSMLF